MSSFQSKDGRVHIIFSIIVMGTHCLGCSSDPLNSPPTTSKRSSHLRQRTIRGSGMRTYAKTKHVGNDKIINETIYMLILEFYLTNPRPPNPPFRGFISHFNHSAIQHIKFLWITSGTGRTGMSHSVCHAQARSDSLGGHGICWKQRAWRGHRVSSRFMLPTMKRPMICTAQS